jgi:hypothetical protein
MLKRFSFLAFSVACLFAFNQPAGAVEVAKVILPQLTPLQWKMLRQQQGTHLRPLPVDVGLTIYNGRVTAATIRRGTGYSDIDKAIANWIETRWTTHAWFGGGNNFVISFSVDPAIRQIVFRRS